MEYAKGKNTMSKLLKSVISIGTFILIVIAIPYIAMFIIWILLFIAAIGMLTWGGFKIVKGFKKIIYRVSTNENNMSQADIFSNETVDSKTIDTNYEDSIIIDVDYESTE